MLKSGSLSTLWLSSKSLAASWRQKKSSLNLHKLQNGTTAKNKKSFQKSVFQQTRYNPVAIKQEKTIFFLQKNNKTTLLGKSKEKAITNYIKNLPTEKTTDKKTAFGEGKSIFVSQSKSEEPEFTSNFSLLV